MHIYLVNMAACLTVVEAQLQELTINLPWCLDADIEMFSSEQGPVLIVGSNKEEARDKEVYLCAAHCDTPCDVCRNANSHTESDTACCSVMNIQVKPFPVCATPRVFVKPSGLSHAQCH